MKAPYFIEILARNGDVLTRHQVDTLPIRIGRSYDNDVIVDDAHSAAQHASIDVNEAGQLVLQDLGSQNGSVHRGKRHNTITMTGNTVVRLGHTSLRVRDATFPVVAEVADKTMHGWEGGIPGLVGLALIVIFAALTTWETDTQSFQAIRYLQAIAGAIAAGLVWGGAWAFANRLFGRHARMGRHLFILGCGVCAMGLFKVVGSLLAYAYSFETIIRYGSHVAILIACGILFFHLSTIRPHHPRRFAINCAILLLLGSSLRLMSNQQSTGRTADELYMTLLLPPAVRHSPDHSVNDFFGEAAKMKAKLDSERVKKVKGGSSESDDDD